MMQPMTAMMTQMTDTFEERARRGEHRTRHVALLKLTHSMGDSRADMLQPPTAPSLLDLADSDKPLAQLHKKHELR